VLLVLIDDAGFGNPSTIRKVVFDINPTWPSPTSGPCTSTPTRPLPPTA
jgi:hypothetical protein